MIEGRDDPPVGMGAGAGRVVGGRGRRGAFGGGSAPGGAA